MKSLLIVSDTHINSTVGLAPPVTYLDDGDSVYASTARRFLIWTFSDILEKAEAKAKRYGSELYGLINGDAVETDAKNRTNQIITRNKETARQMAIDVFTPYFGICKGVYVVRGTEAHVGLQAEAEESLAANFDNTIKDEENGRASWQFLRLELDGVRMHIAHHPKGGGGGRPMNAHAGIDRIASDALFMYANMREPIPHLVINSHLHGYRDSGNRFATRAIITPALSLLTSYVYRIGINFSEPIGAILITCHEGRYHVEPLLYPVRKATWQIL